MLATLKASFPQQLLFTEPNELRCFISVADSTLRVDLGLAALTVSVGVRGKALRKTLVQTCA